MSFKPEVSTSLVMVGFVVSQKHRLSQITDGEEMEL